MDASAKIEITQQLALFLENSPGTLARVCEALKVEGINIYAISTSDTVDHTVVRLVLSDTRKALLLFEERGALVVESDVLTIEGDNRPGVLAEICERLSKAKVNIEYLYSATAPRTRKGILVLRVSNPRRALKVLQQ